MIDDKLTSLLASASKYLQKAVDARERFYKGMNDAALSSSRGGDGPEDRKYSFGNSVQGKQLIADNKWHMAQARTFALIAIARAGYLLVLEQRRTNQLLEQVVEDGKVRRRRDS